MPDMIRHPDVVPTKVGNHIKDWVPVFSRNPVSSDNYENTGHRFSPVRRLFTKPSTLEFRIRFGFRHSDFGFLNYGEEVSDAREGIGG